MDSEDTLAKVKEVSEGVRETARGVKQSLEEGQSAGPGARLSPRGGS